MSRLQPVMQPTSETQKTIYAEITAAFGMVPNIFRVYAHSDAVLQANWNKVKQVMMAGSLSRKVKETIAVVVSNDNGCNYCVTHHSMALKSLGVADQELTLISTQPRDAAFDESEKALIALARQANRDPHQVTAALVQGALSAGATPAQVIEALAVMETFVAFNRTIDTLHVQLEM